MFMFVCMKAFINNCVSVLIADSSPVVSLPLFIGAMGDHLLLPEHTLRRVLGTSQS